MNDLMFCGYIMHNADVYTGTKLGGKFVIFAENYYMKVRGLSSSYEKVSSDYVKFFQPLMLLHANQNVVLKIEQDRWE